MTARLLCSALLFGLALNAHAEIAVYDFFGHFSSEREGADPATHFPAGFRISEQFSGTIIYDPEGRLPNSDSEAAAPVLSFYIEAVNGDSVVSQTQLPSSIAARRPAGLEHVALSMDTSFLGHFFTTTGRFRGTAKLDWGSGETGQLPASIGSDPNAVRQIDPSTLRPNVWTVEITNSGECWNACDPNQASTIKGTITRLGPRFAGGISYLENFDSAPSGWTNQGGAWVTQNGYYRNTANVQFTSSIYRAVQLGTSYVLRVTPRSQWRAAGNTLGILLHYRDDSNFDEIRFNPLGTATYSRVANGKRTLLRTAGYDPLPGSPFFSVEVARRGPSVAVAINGGFAIFNVGVNELRDGHAGLFASWNQARFGDFHLQQDPLVWDVSPDSFQPTSGVWTPVLGNWTVTDGFYQSSSNLTAAISTYQQLVSNYYSVNASLYLEWPKSGNRGGLVYDYRDVSNYRAVLVSPGTRVNGVSTPGTLQVIEIRNGERRVLAAVAIRSGGPWVLPKQWTPVGVQRLGNLTAITAYGNRIILNQPIVFGAKHVGLLASFNRVRFDDVVVATQR